jgi:hypothetical protein
MKINDRFSFSFFEPVVSWNRPVMFVGFTVSLFPIEILTATDPQPSDDLPVFGVDLFRR